VVTISERGKPIPQVTWRHRGEAAAAALFFGLCRALPLDAASGLAGWLARRIGPFISVSKQARRNLAAALPELSAAEIETIVRGMWDNIGRVAAEYPHLDRIRVFENDGRVEVSGMEHVDKALAEERRMILFAGHLANWELGPLAGAQYGLRTTQIYRSANNPRVDQMIQRHRASLGGEFIPKEEAGRGALAALRRGAHLGILVDQKLNEGIPVPFFGRPAMTAPTLAVLALRFDCAVLPVHVERLAGARFRLTVEPPLPLPDSGNRTADVTALMAAVNATLERWIRERPEQWFWVHRRWPDDTR
jgi:Kdo2-lipid IVA lauroyltransferase/acyltransferase